MPLVRHTNCPTCGGEFETMEARPQKLHQRHYSCWRGHRWTVDDLADLEDGLGIEPGGWV